MKLKTTVLLILFMPVWLLARELPPFKVNVREIKEANTLQKTDMRKACKLFEKIMNDSEFQKELLATTFYFHGKKDPNYKLTTAQIADKIYSGKESFEADTDHEADIFWELFEDFDYPETIGSGFPSKPEIYTRPSFINKRNMEEITNHIAHEYTHKFGFIDGNYRGNRRRELVSYAFGDLVESYVQKYDTE